MKKLLSIILSLTMLLSSAMLVSADGIDDPKSVETIKVAVNAEFPPFEYYENDRLEGFDIELMNTICAKIGYEIEYVNVQFDEIIPAVISGKVDCAISAITATEERAKAVDFTNAYLFASNIHLSSRNQEKYAVVFPLNSSAKSKTSIAAGKETLYAQVDNAIIEMINDGTIDKLIDKYELNKPLENGDENSVEYYTMKAVPGGADISDNNDNTKSEEQYAFETIDAASPVYLPSDWAVESVDRAKAVGLIDKAKVYQYEKNITREEFCEIIYNYCVNILNMIKPVEIQHNFTDTDNAHIKVLYGAGIINGKSDTKFAPDDNLTREEAATILVRMVNKTIDVPVHEIYYEFEDSGDISEWADGSVQVMCNMGVMHGVGNNKFAPKATYTTEQAIATVMRIYDAQLAAGNVDVGIIGGADGPTSIFVGGVIPEEPKEITIGEDVAVDDFYIDEAVKLATETGKMAADKAFVSMYVSQSAAQESFAQLGALDYSKPTEMYYVSFNPDKVAEFYKELSDDDVDIEKILAYRKFNLSVFANMINGRYGAENLAAMTILTNRKGYIMPKDYIKDFGLYLLYEGNYSVLVTFDEIGDGVIEARMQYVRTGDQGSILSFMSELYQSFGKEAITIGKVK